MMNKINSDAKWPEKELVSIIIPVYKVEKYLCGSIESAINQTYQNIEIILVDDGSPDFCPQICDKYAQEFMNIKVVHKTNGGLSDARNAGMNVSQGTYILFFDSDDKLAPDAVENMVNIARRDAVDVVIPDRFIKVYEESKKEKLSWHLTKDMYISDPITFALDVLIDKGRAWRAHSLLYKAEVIRQNNIKFPIGTIAEDYFFNLDVMKKIKKISFYEGSTVFYLKRSGSITTTFNPKLFGIYFDIDRATQKFLTETKTDTQKNINKRKSLLARNMTSFIFDIYCKKNTLSKDEKDNYFMQIVNDSTIADAYNSDIDLPYYQNRMIVIAFWVIYQCIRIKAYAPIKIMLNAVGKMGGV